MAVVRLKLNKHPRAKSLWTLVRRLLLLRRSRKQQQPAAAVEQDSEGEKSRLLSRSSLEQLLVTSSTDGAACRCAKKLGQPVAPLRPEAADADADAAAGAASPTGGAHRGAAPAAHRRFMFGGFRRRLLMRRPWRPMLVAIPE